MVERIRDATVAQAIAAEAGTDATPELMLSELVSPVILLQQRPPLASSDYFPGTIGVTAAAVSLNTSHVGLFISGFGGAIGRINWVLIQNTEAGLLTYELRRLDAPFTDWPSVRAVPGYINAGGRTTGRAFSITKTDTVAVQGLFMANFRVEAASNLLVPGPWIVNDGALVVAAANVDTAVRVSFGYEVWPAIRPQPQG